MIINIKKLIDIFLLTEPRVTFDTFNQIDLANYIPQRKSNNCVVFVHKDEFYYEDHKKDHEENVLLENESQSKVPILSHSSHDRLHKADTYTVTCQNCKHQCNEPHKKSKMVVAKENMLPIVLPKSISSSPIVYTIKTSKKKKSKKLKCCDDDDDSFARDGDTVFEETIKRKRPDIKTHDMASDALNLNISGIESENYSSVTSDRQMTKSVSCSISENSCNRYFSNKHEYLHNRLHEHKSQSENADRLITANYRDREESKTNANVMSDKERTLLIESIKTPIINAFKECIGEMKMNKDDTANNKMTQRLIKMSMIKMNKIYEKLSEMEDKILVISEDTMKYRNDVTQAQTKKRLKLEELSEDMEDFTETEIVNDLSAENTDLVENFNHGTTVLLSPDRKQVSERLVEGEVAKENPILRSASRPECFNKRIPARFCWTDSTHIK